eukprot:TRINITY_DN9679_c0_g2_i1.p1 TRINITY_DN9679_c0_g2~~TRINITY_DN9679_c0_g2_i1.p1  ORF type:complete len:213 (+),score=36.77 TRINITY_DN9679_c0_g2_i1:434-1072(+)
MMDLCYVSVEETLDLYSHITDLYPHPDPDFWNRDRAYLFPLAGSGPFLCTQGCNGTLTHFKPSNLHALDFRCPVGTSVLAVADGQVVEIVDSNSVSGIHAKNLFTWNFLVLRLKDGTHIEYVHIRKDSARVRVGDLVSMGQVLCESGDVGFCPEPHLHIQAQISDTHKNTTKIGFLNGQKECYIPQAGRWYNFSGLCGTPKNIDEPRQELLR